MGKGDKRTRKGKIFNRSYGIKRLRKPKKKSINFPIEKKRAIEELYLILRKNGFSKGGIKKLVEKYNNKNSIGNLANNSILYSQEQFKQLIDFCKTNLKDKNNKSVSTYDSLIKKIEQEINITFSAQELEEIKFELRESNKNNGQIGDVNEDQILSFILEKKPNDVYSRSELINKVKVDFNAELKIDEIDFLQTQFYKKVRKYYTKESNSFEFYYDKDFYDLLVDTKKLNDSEKENRKIPDLSEENRSAIFWERKNNAEDTILNASRLDATKENHKHKRNLDEIRKDITKTDCSFSQEREKIIRKLEKLATPINKLPIEFISKADIMDCLVQNNFEIDDLDFEKIIKDYTINFEKNDLIDEKDKSKFYFNEAFYNHLMFYLRKIENQFNSPDFIGIFDGLSNIASRPIIYSIKEDDNVDSPINNKQIKEVLEEYDSSKQEYDRKLSELQKEEKENDRGAVFMNQPKFEVKSNHLIYAFDTKYYSKVLIALINQSIDMKEANRTATSLLTTLYDNYYEYIFPQYNGKDKLTFQDFEIKLKQQYYYFDNGFRRVRLDLFREKNEKTEDNSDWFQGGILHALHHFRNFGSTQKGENESFIINEFHSNLMDIIFNGEIKASSKMKSGDYRIILEKECEISSFNTQNNLFEKKPKNFRAVLFYNVKKMLYYLDTYHIY